MDGPKSYIICTSPRSGSTLLCKLLSGTGKAGHPDSHFHDPSLAAWLRYFDLDQNPYPSAQAALKAVFSAAYAQGSGHTGLFGLRLQRRSFEFFMQQLMVLFPGFPNDHARLSAAFGQTLIIHLTRDNKLEQAISYVKASQTGLWHMAPDGTELERLSAPQKPVYDAAAIAEHMALCEKMDAQWDAWFRVEDIHPLRITYADLSANPFGVLAHIFEHLGIEYQPDTNTSLPVAKLADVTSQNWAERFLAETGDAVANDEDGRL